MPAFVPIVEGHGEVAAVPILLRRIGQTVAGGGRIAVNQPIRVKATSFVSFGDDFERYIRLATAKAKALDGEVLILLDCEDDCPATLGPQLRERALAVRNDVPITVVLAYREYETWFVAAASSLAGQCDLPETLEPPPDPERIRDAKGWLASRLPRRYDEVIHQREFSLVFDLELARAIPSFERLYRHVARRLASA